MEIKYSLFEPDNNVFGKNDLTGLIDSSDKYLINNIYDLKTFSYNGNQKVLWFLYLGETKAKRELINTFYNKLELSKELYKRPLKKLSESELTKILIIKLLVKNIKTLVLNHIDTGLNSRDLNDLLKFFKNYKDKINKNIIFVANKADNIILHVDKYLIIKDENVAYNGSKLEEIPLMTEIKEFTDLANANGANIKYYKEVNDLLKAIYRSVKK